MVAQICTKNTYSATTSTASTTTSTCYQLWACLTNAISYEINVFSSSNFKNFIYWSFMGSQLIFLCSVDQFYMKDLDTETYCHRKLQLPCFMELTGNKHLETKIWGAPTEVHPSKNRRMPFKAPRTRYSLVKGERIVRFVLNAWLRGFYWLCAAFFYTRFTRKLLLSLLMWDS